MAAAEHNLVGSKAIEAWSTFDRTFNLIDQNGDPVDLTLVDPDETAGAVGIRVQLRATADIADGSGEPLVDLSDDATAALGDSWVIITAPATSGSIQVSMSWQDTGGLQSDLTTPFGARPDGELTFPVRWGMVGIGAAAGTYRYRLALMYGDVEIRKGVVKVAD